MNSRQKPEEALVHILEKSSFYGEFLAEREEILRHKWYKSEKAGQDIGFERALLDWVRHHRTEWKTARRLAHPYNDPKPTEVFAKMSGQCA